MPRDLFQILIFVVLWFLLMRFILPALGVPTCMGGACQIKREEKMKAEKERVNESIQE
ncbi:MAG: hypothetical protein AB1656_01910 [Candidatus Omnitrophota bacterium]